MLSGNMDRISSLRNQPNCTVHAVQGIWMKGIEIKKLYIGIVIHISGVCQWKGKL
jgi:hypothetical protein